MATIEKKPLPPLNSKVTKITEADRAEINARANDVIDHYLNGPGSYFDSGTRKLLTGEPGGESTVEDLNSFKRSVIASMQFADDPNSIMASVIDLIDHAKGQVEKAAQNNEGRDSIVLPHPEIADPIDDPRVTSPRALNNSALPISQSSADAIAGGAHNATRDPSLSHDQKSQSPMFGPGVPTAPFATSYNPNRMAGLVGRIAALAAGVSENPEQPVPDLLAQQPDAGNPSAVPASRPERYLSREVAGQPDVSAFGSGAPAVPFVQTDQSFIPGQPASFDDRFGDWTSSPAVNAPRGSYQPAPPQASRPLGIISGKPMSNWPVPPPIWDFPDKSAASEDDSKDWLARLLRSVGSY